MTQAHVDPSPIGRPARPDRPEAGAGGTDPASAQRAARPVPVPGLIAPDNGPRVIRRMKADAERYVQDEGIDLTVNKVNVTDYVNDRANDAALREGLLDAWNLNASAQWVIDTPPDLRAVSANPFHHSNLLAYQGFTTSSTGVSITAFGGPVSAYYNHGAPKIGSAAANWGKVKLGDSYVEYIRGLRSGGQSDAAIAKVLLDLDESAFVSHLENRAAAMLTVTVYLAEEWRKQGAAKIYRAILRLIVKGTRTFDDLLDDFKFIAKATDGRKQVARFQDVWLGDAEREDMDTDEGEIYDEQSQIQDDDYSSGDDMRTDEKKNTKGKRLFAQKHKSK